jgi:hypothetical protein
VIAADAAKANIKTMYSFMLDPPDDEPNSMTLSVFYFEYK